MNEGPHSSPVIPAAIRSASTLSCTLPIPSRARNRAPTPRSQSSARSSRLPIAVRRSPRLSAPSSSQDHAEPPLPRAPEPSNLFKMWHPKYPERWEFIHLVPGDQWASLPIDKLNSKMASSAYCTKCHSLVKYSHGSTNAVKLHMQKYHMDVLVRAEQDRQEIRARTAKRQLQNAFDLVLESTKRQLTAVTKAQQSYANGLLAKWVAQSMRLPAIIEDPGLLELIVFITQELGGVVLDVPGATQLRADIERVAAELSTSLKARIHTSCQYFCITTDIWTSRRAQSYMALTLHYLENLEEDFTMCSWTLEVEVFPGMHTGVAIATGLEKMLERWEFNLAMCTLFVRDGASNAVLASDILGVNNISRIAHSLQLVLGSALARQKGSIGETMVANSITTAAIDVPVHGGTLQEDEIAAASEERQQEVLSEIEINLRRSLKNDIAAKRALADIRDVVQRFRTLATYFRKSPKATNRLDAIQSEEWKRPPLHLITDCPTRWNSCRDMLERLIELEAPLDTFFTYLEKPEGKAEFRDLRKDKYPCLGIGL